MAVTLNDRHITAFIKGHELEGMQPLVSAAHTKLHDKTGLGGQKDPV